jgi:hypothetical protein
MADRKRIRNDKWELAEEYQQPTQFRGATPERNSMKKHCSDSPRPWPAVFSIPFLVILIAIPLLSPAGLAQSDNMYIYPAKGQSQAQQDKDRYECHTWAVNQTGFDPSKPSSQTAMPAASAPNTYQPSQRHIAGGAARGAALGAVGGAITGDAGKGAAAGAAMGGLAGGFRRRQERKQQQASQQQSAQQQQAAQQQSQSAAYQRAMAACLQGRGYTVN